MNQAQANEELRSFERNFPKRKIMNVEMEPVEWPGGWFMTIVYDVEIK